MTSVECPICQNYYGDNDHDMRAPRLLNCGHTLCTQCLKDHFIKHKKDFCPCCRKQFNNIVVEDLIINRAIYDILREKGITERGEQYGNEISNSNNISNRSKQPSLKKNKPTREFSIALLGSGQ